MSAILKNVKMTILKFFGGKNMKKFTVMILCVSTFFIGLGGLIESVGARFKSDERALEIIRLARQAIGGEANIKAVQSLTLSGKATKTFEFDKIARVEKGDWELNLQMPNKISKMMKVMTEDNVGTENPNKHFDVVIVKKGDGTEKETVSTDSSQKVVIVKKREGDKTVQNEDSANGNIKKVIVEGDLRASFDKMQQNDLFRTTLSLLLTAPQGIEAEYIYAGEGSVDGNSCDIIEARSGGSSVKLFLDKLSHLPRMMSFTDAKPMIFFKIKKDDLNTEENGETKTFTRKLDAPQMAEFQIKFSDYRSVNGLQLPHLWTQTVGGNVDETIEISGYEINPANIADKFNNLPPKIMIRTERKAQ